MTGSLNFEAIIRVMADGKEHRISEEVYDYFLNVLPPVVFRSMSFQGKSWSFGFAEGVDLVTLFRKQGDDYFARQTPWYNPMEAGSIEGQKKRLLLKWVEIGRKNESIRKATQSPFNTLSFHECHTDSELLDKFKEGNWGVGQAFHIGDLCFIQQADGSDKWLAIKGQTAFETINFGHIIASKGMEVAQLLIDGIRASSELECRNLHYGRGR